MIDKKTLKQSNPFYADLLLALGFDEESGNVIELVSGQSVGVLNTNASRSSDSTYGSTISSDGTLGLGGIDLGDLTAFGGLSQCTFFILQKSVIGLTDSNRKIWQKDGGGADTGTGTWQSSEDVGTSIGIAGTNYGNTIADGLDENIGIDPKNWHLYGFILDTSAGVATISTFLNSTINAGSAVPVDGVIQDTAHNLLIHPDWHGQMAVVGLIGRAISQTELNSIVSDPVQFFLQPAALSSPSIDQITSSQARFNVETNTANGEIFWYASQSATPPTIADLKAGTGAVSGGSILNPALGVNSDTVTGLSPSTSYYIHAVQNYFNSQTSQNEDTAVITSPQFTTTIVTPVILDVDGDDSVSDGQQDVVITGVDFGGSGIVSLSDGTYSIVQNVDSYSDTSITVDIDSGLDAAIQGAAIPVNAVPITDSVHSLQIVVNDGTNQDTHTIAVEPPAGYQTASVTVADAITDPGSIFDASLGVTVEDGQQITIPITVVDDNLTFEVVNGNATGRILTDGDGNASFTAYLYTPSTGQITSIDVTLVAGEYADITPDEFLFFDQIGVTRSAVVESNVITVTGVDAGVDVPISVVGGEYAVDAGSGFGGFTSAPTTVQLGYDVKLRVSASDQYNTAVESTLTIGYTSATFRAITEIFINTPPTVDDASFQVSELAAIGTLVGTVSFNDIDPQTMTFTFLSGNTGDSFAVDSNGNITTSGILNPDVVPIYTLTLQVDDGAGGTDTATVTIEVTPAAGQNAPVISNPGTLTVTLPEGVSALDRDHTDVQTWISTFTASDVEDGPVPVVHDIPAQMPISASPVVTTLSATDADGNTTTLQTQIVIQQLSAAVDLPQPGITTKGGQGDYVDLLITLDDITPNDAGLPWLVTGRASIAQDIKHMVRETGLLVEMIAQRNAEAIQQGMNRIEQKVESDLRIVPGTARVTRTDINTFYITARTVKYGQVEVYL